MRTTPFGRYPAALLAAILLALPLPVAAEDPYTPLRLELGAPDGRMVFNPTHLELRVGTRYRLSLVNVGPVEHEFDAPELTLNAESEHVVVYDRAGNKVADLVGKPDEVVVAPGARLDWYLMPVRAAAGPILCDLPGHLEAGMRGTFRVR
jgi:uncharacterized cupredoxin-like copper-binding protein